MGVAKMHTPLAGNETRSYTVQAEGGGKTDAIVPETHSKTI